MEPPDENNDDEEERLEDEIERVVREHCGDEAAESVTRMKMIPLVFRRNDLLPLLSNGDSVSNVKHAYETAPNDCYEQLRAVCRHLKMVRNLFFVNLSETLSLTYLKPIAFRSW